MDQKKNWLNWAIELQSLAQAGLFYGKDIFDRERYQRIREIAAEMVSIETGLPTDRVTELFCNESGYQTPKIDTRAAVFCDNRILLVEEFNGKWSLPGGWCDVNISVKENTIKEVKEEAGLDVTADLVIAVQDRSKHNLPQYAYGICKIFILCSPLGGEFQPNSETLQRQWFSLNELPPLAEDKNNKDQIRMCFDAYHAEHWTTLFD